MSETPRCDTCGAQVTEVMKDTRLGPWGTGWGFCRCRSALWMIDGVWVKEFQRLALIAWICELLDEAGYDRPRRT